MTLLSSAMDDLDDADQLIFDDFIHESPDLSATSIVTGIETYKVISNLRLPLRANYKAPQVCPLTSTSLDRSVSHLQGISTDFHEYQGTALYNSNNSTASGDVDSDAFDDLLRNNIRILVLETQVQILQEQVHGLLAIVVLMGDILKGALG